MLLTSSGSLSCEYRFLTIFVFPGSLSTCAVYSINIPLQAVSWDWISTPPYLGHPTQLISGKNSKVCCFSGLQTDCRLLFLGLENNGTILLSRTHLHGENNSPQSALYTDHNTVILSCTLLK